MKFSFVKSSRIAAPLLACVLAGAGIEQTSAQLLRLGIGPTKVGKSLADDMQRRGKTIEMGRVTEALDGQFTSAFVGTAKFEVIARTDLQSLLDREQGLPVGTVVDPETAAQSGKIKGLEDMVVISVDSFLDSMDKLDATSGYGVQVLKRRVQLSCVAKIYDCSTGKVLASPTFQREKTFPVPIQKNETSSGERTDELLIKMAREMAELMANRTVDILLPAKIVDIDADGKTLTINRGDGGGMKAGQVWDLYGPTKEVPDPDTGKKMKIKGKKLGQVRITTVDAETSQGELIAGAGVQVFSVLTRPPEPSPAPAE